MIEYPIPGQALPSQRYARPFFMAALSLLLAACAAVPAPRQTATAPTPTAGAVTPPQAVAATPAVPAPPQPAPSAMPAAAPIPPPASLPVPAAASDKATILRNWIAQQQRLYRVAAPLLIQNTELCPQHARNLLGFTAKNRYSYTDDFAETAQTTLGLEERLQVMSVFPGSGAEAAGLRQGDTLFAVEIEPLPQGPQAENASAAIIGTELRGRNSVSLTVLRAGERIVHNISLTPACAMVIDLGNTGHASSLADGQRVMVTRGMLDSVQSDEELAYILAREIAHNILAPQPRRDIAAEIDRLHTLAPPANDETGAPLPAYPPDLELRARKLALYLLARAGYSIDNAPGFWQKFAGPPPSPETLTELAQTIGAIAARKQLGGALVPEQP